MHYLDFTAPAANRVYLLILTQLFGNYIIGSLEMKMRFNHARSVCHSEIPHIPYPIFHTL